MRPKAKSIRTRTSSPEASKWKLVRPLRKWQQEARLAWNQEKRGVISVVTGAGKTIFAMACMQLIRDANPRAQFTIIVPTLALMDQWYIDLQEDFGIDENDIALYSGRDRPNASRAVNIMVINTARKLAPIISLDGPTMLIVDECHRIATPTNAKALAGAYVAVLGLSATPEREYDDGFIRLIQPVLGPIVYEYGQARAAVDGVISPFSLINVSVPLLDSEKLVLSRFDKRIAIEQRRVTTGQSDEGKLKRLLHERARVSANVAYRIPVTGKIVDNNRGIRCLVFHESVQAANKILEVLVARGHSATIYHSQIGPLVRRDNLRLFKKGIFDVLVCCRALDEGLNVPQTTVAVIASSTASARQRIQRLGRVLRPAPGKDSATVYTLYATSQEEQRLLREEVKLGNVSEIRWIRSAR